jgi:hypothetical protein
MKRWLGKLSIGSALALVGVVALLGGVASLALRGDSSAAVEQSAAKKDRNDGPPWLRGGHFQRPSAKQILDRRKKFHKELADELGVSTEKVDAAFRNLFVKRLDQAVEDGNLTRKQADSIKECYDNPDKCKPPSGMRGRFHGPPGGGPPMGGPGPGGFGGPPPGVGPAM